MSEKTGRLPEALLRKPELKRWNVKYISAFQALSPSRSHSESPHPLKFSDIITYGKLTGILNDADLLFFYQMVRLCDEQYLIYHQENSKTEG